MNPSMGQTDPTMTASHGMAVPNTAIEAIETATARDNRSVRATDTKKRVRTRLRFYDVAVDFRLFGHRKSQFNQSSHTVSGASFDELAPGFAGARRSGNV